MLGAKSKVIYKKGEAMTGSLVITFSGDLANRIHVLHRFPTVTSIIISGDTQPEECESIPCGLVNANDSCIQEMDAVLLGRLEQPRLLLLLILCLRKTPLAQLITTWGCPFPNRFDLFVICPQAKETRLVRDLLSFPHLKIGALQFIRDHSAPET